MCMRGYTYRMTFLGDFIDHDMSCAGHHGHDYSTMTDICCDYGCGCIHHYGCNGCDAMGTEFGMGVHLVNGCSSCYNLRVMRIVYGDF